MDGPFRFAAIQLTDQSEMVPSGKNIYAHASRNQRGAEPQRQSVRLSCGDALHDLHLLQKKPEARHHKTESHQGQAGTNPCQ
jgi:hypothetical protein